MIGFTVTLNDVNFLVTITVQLFGAKFQQTFKKMTHLLKTLTYKIDSGQLSKIAAIQNFKNYQTFSLKQPNL